MTETTNAHKCGKIDCVVTTTGHCSDGFTPLEACPAYGKPAIASPATLPPLAPPPSNALLQKVLGKKSVQTPENNLATIKLPSGEALESDDIAKMVLAHPIKMVVIIGDRWSGKSTLIGTLYDMFRKGPFGKYAFSGSRTLVGFDKLSFNSRVESGELVPDTIRTSRLEGLKFFHLELSEFPTYNLKNHLVISDRAGEVYEEARANTERLKELHEVRQSLTLVIMLDGAKLTDPAQKHNAFAGLRQTLRGLAEINYIGPNSNVQIVISKYDLVLSNADCTSLTKQIEDFNAKLATDYKDRFAELTFWNIAARDPLFRVNFANGLSELLDDWMNKKRTQIKQSIPILTVEGSEFDMLLNRV